MEKGNLINKTHSRINNREIWFINFYKKLIEYKEKNSNFIGITQDPEIGRTAESVRRAYKYQNDPTKKGLYKLTPEIIDALNQIDFPWEATKQYGENRDWFEEFIEQLKLYKQKHGSFANITADKKIGYKVDGIRKAYKGYGQYKLTQEMIDQLNEINFSWEREDWFTPFYEKLKDYKNTFGTFYGITTDKKIGTIVARIRQAYKGKGKTKLTKEMIQLLNEIGFPWERTPKTVKNYDFLLK